MLIISEKSWPNGQTLKVIDHSRPVAADRWHVKVVGYIGWPMWPEYQAGLISGDEELDGLIRQKLGGRLEYRLVRERNFIDATVKDELIEQLLEQLLAIVGRYLDDEVFPVRLAAMRCREIKELCLVERARGRKEGAGDNEPFDFSHCFK